MLTSAAVLEDSDEEEGSADRVHLPLCETKATETWRDVDVNPELDEDQKGDSGGRVPLPLYISATLLGESSGGRCPLPPREVKATGNCRGGDVNQELQDYRCHILQLPDWKKEFVVRTDASDSGVGAVLLQEVDGMLKPITYISKKLLPRETRYSTIEKECLAIVWAVERFQVYLYGREFVLQTDHQPLTFMDKARLTNSRVMRWALTLQPFRFRLESIPGKDNVGADFLSRVDPG